jgi:hypothetical protein
MKHKFTRLLCLTLLVAAPTTSFIQPASAKVIENSWETMPFEYFNECEGEWVVGTIQAHLIWILNDGKVDSVHTNITGTGVGEISGTTYIAKNNSTSDFSDFVCGGTAVRRANVRLISRGKASNLDANIQIKYELDANCNLLPPQFTVDVRCQK